MPTLMQPSPQSSISGDAMDVMNRFTSGLDDVVYELAEKTAQRRSPSAADVQIEVEDVKEAARLLFQGLRDASEKGQVARSFEPALNAMQESFLNLCEKD